MSRWLGCILVAILAIPAGIRGADPTAFFEEYCTGCHNAKKQKGDFRIDNLSRDFGDMLVAQDWDELMFRINSGEMPPEDEDQPGAVEVGEVVDWISERIEEGRAERMSKRTPVTLYRLSRKEYAHAVFDLLGVHFDVEAPGAFNEDPRWHGYDRIGSLLSLSPSHVDRYYEAAQKIVNEAFPEKSPRESRGRYEALDDRRTKTFIEERGLKETPRMLLLPGLPAGSIRTHEAGLYRIRIQLSAIPSFKGRLPHLTLWDSMGKRSLYGEDVLAAEDKPVVVEIETFLPAGNIKLMNEAPASFDTGRTLSHTREVPFFRVGDRRFVHPASHKLYRANGDPIFPMLIVDWFEWEGPIVTENAVKKRAPFYPADEMPETVRESLSRFMERAWRRLPSESELDRMASVVKSELESGESFRSAYLAALTAAMTAQEFYYHQEGSPGEKRPRINDWELASRLSFFLWNSIPDESLLAEARSGNLSGPDELRAQLNRMLDHSKVDRFLASFPRQWLQLHRVDEFPPDRELYPDYDNWLEKSMILESTEYFRHVFRNNLPVREFLASDWTMLNSRIAMHYGFPSPGGTGFQKVNLKPSDNRGGILTQASVLSLASDGTRHRPVHRGVWVSEAVFGKTPPPPPPNVEPLEPTPLDEPKATIRMQLEAHATHSTCASCHRKIDPLGFAFDNYDAIGRWRTEEESNSGLGENPAVDASGTIPGRGDFNGPAAFKDLLVKDEDRFALAFTGQLATYALRRVMTIDDKGQLEAIAGRSKESKYRLRSLVENLVLSDLFLKR